mgnify:CR=1 FL=1
MSTEFRYPVRIYYEDTDAGGVVYYANYLKFFERCRTEWLRSFGHHQTDLLANHDIAFVVKSVAADYKRPGRLDDALDGVGSGPFTLIDKTGKAVTDKDVLTKPALVYFGYTFCPDVCPLDMARNAEAVDLLQSKGLSVAPVFITIDPERDTAELLKAYMANFDPTFIALRPTPEQLAQVARDFKIYYKKVEGKSATSYTMDHSAGSYTFDPQGRVRLFNRYGSGAQALADDVKLLLKGV